MDSFRTRLFSFRSPTSTCCSYSQERIIPPICYMMIHNNRLNPDFFLFDTHRNGSYCPTTRTQGQLDETSRRATPFLLVLLSLAEFHRPSIRDLLVATPPRPRGVFLKERGFVLSFVQDNIIQKKERETTTSCRGAAYPNHRCSEPAMGLLIWPLNPVVEPRLLPTSDPTLLRISRDSSSTSSSTFTSSLNTTLPSASAAVLLFVSPTTTTS